MPCWTRRAQHPRAHPTAVFRFNVAVLGLSTDMRDLTQEVRASSQHAQDALAVVKAIRAVTTRPVWLVGTSRGTISAAAAAVLDQGQLIDGIVLTSVPPWNIEIAHRRVVTTRP